MNWNKTQTLVTGGASFIGSHLVDALVERGAKVRVVDDLSSGKLENIAGHLRSEQRDSNIRLIVNNLLSSDVAKHAVEGVQVVFHLAAIHGGRGYVDTHQAGPASNLALDGLLLLAAHRAGVERVVYASSGCVYPNYLQSDPDQEVYLTEEMVGPPYEADNLYGWAKLMGEMGLRAYCDERGMKGVSCRYFTVYGRRGKEDHAVMAMIARAFAGQDPFVVWGDGRQVRNWTHVSDIVSGTLLAAERIDDGSAVNLGTMERTTVMDAARLVLDYTGHGAEIKLRPDMPTGPPNRVADNGLAERLLGWRPEVSFADGLRDTIEWYFETKEPEEVRQALGRLTER